MQYLVYRFETKAGVDYRVVHGNWQRSRSKCIGYIESPTRQGAVNQLKDKLDRAIRQLVRN